MTKVSDPPGEKTTVVSINSTNEQGHPTGVNLKKPTTPDRFRSNDLKPVILLIEFPYPNP